MPTKLPPPSLFHEDISSQEEILPKIEIPLIRKEEEQKLAKPRTPRRSVSKKSEGQNSALENSLIRLGIRGGATAESRRRFKRLRSTYIRFKDSLAADSIAALSKYNHVKGASHVVEEEK